jgi:predicted ATPase/class 3 adenylate cyclase/Tfp pilus assembly protein PilF
MATESQAQTSFILFTDIYRSSSLWERYPNEFSRALEAHNAIVEKTVDSRGGEVMKNLGDGYIALFNTSSSCVEAMVDVERGISALPPLPDETQLRLRLVAHGGPIRRLAIGGGYFGHALNRASRIVQVCNPGQALASEAVRAHLHDLPQGASLSDLGTHFLRDLEKPEKLYQLNHPDFALHKFPPLATLNNHPNNLVCQPNTFIGREREINELKELVLDGKQRLITITAPGGYGKSRLATQLCADLLEDFENGVFEVLLAPVASHERIVGTTASALGFHFYDKSEPLQQLINYLSEKSLLVSFDNFEHVVEGKKLLIDILRNAPKVSILVTSREPLRLKAEKVYPLAPLMLDLAENGGAGVPPVTTQTTRSIRGRDGRATNDSLALQPDFLPESVQLFIDRAMLVMPCFALTQENLALAREICVKLDGVPLAIEMAAGWADSFTLSELLAEVEQQIELTARMDDVPERQRSIRASLDWSYNLLREGQECVLHSAAAFKGGFFLEAAESIACREGNLLSPLDSDGQGLMPRFPANPEEGAIFLESGLLFEPESSSQWHDRKTVRAFQKKLRKTLSELCEKGWLYTRETLGKTRFFIRDAAAYEYALEKLRESTEYEAVVLAHSEYYAELVEQEGKRLSSHGQLDAVKLLGVELENIYEALGCALARKDAKLLLLFAKRLETYLDMVSLWRDGLPWYERLVDAGRVLGEKPLQAYGARGLGQLFWRLGYMKRADKFCKEGLLVLREIGDLRGIAASLNNLGVIAHVQGRYDEAEKQYQESLQIQREAGDSMGIAMSLNCLGALAYYQGRYEEAEKQYQESLQIKREIGDRRGTAASLNNLGLIDYVQGRYKEAERRFHESLQIQRETGDRLGAAGSYSNLGLVAYNRGRYSEGEKLFQESLRTFCEIGDHLGKASSLNHLGNIILSQGRYKEAEKLFGESLQIAREIDNRLAIIASLKGLGYAIGICQGCYKEAEKLLSESLQIAREIGHRWWIAAVLADLGNVTIGQGRFAEAEKLWQEGLQIQREIGDRCGIAKSLCDLGSWRAKQRKVQEARECLSEGVLAAKEICAPTSIICGIIAVGYLIVQMDGFPAAAVILSGTKHIATKINYVLEPFVRGLLDDGMAVVQTALSAEELAALTALGEKMTQEELADYALKALEELEM